MRKRTKKKIVLAIGIALAVILMAVAIPHIVRLLKPEPHFLEKLQAPQNVQIVDFVLTWDAVENATGYIVSFAHTEYETQECCFDLSSYDDPGNYEIAIRACGNSTDYEDSDWSNTIFTIDAPPAKPEEVEHPAKGYDESGLFYTILDDGWGYEVSAGRAKLTKELYIPDYFCGLPVKRIADFGFTSTNDERNHRSVMEFYCNTVTTSIRLPAYLEKIGHEAFAAMVRLEEVVIPDTVTELGVEAFLGCTSLKKVVLPKGLKKIPRSCFEDTALCEIVWSEKLEVIGQFAFRCEYWDPDWANEQRLDHSKIHIDSDLTSITLPATVWSIGGKAFEGRWNLETVNLTSENIRALDATAFDDTRLEALASQNGGWIYFGEILYQYIGEMPENFEVVIPAGVRKIAGSAFQGQVNLKKIVLPAGLTFIGGKVFENCTSLSEVALPEDLEDLRDSTFEGATSLKSISLPDTLARIGTGAFRHSGLESIVIPDGVQIIGRAAFNGCYSLAYVHLPQGLEKLEAFTFKECSSLLQLDFLPEGLKEIGTSAFEGCSSLTEVYLPDALETIANDAFRNCAQLEFAILPKSIETLSHRFMSQCPTLKAIYFAGDAAQWEVLYQALLERMGSNAQSSPPCSNAIIYCYSETEPTEPGRYWHYVDGEATPWFE